MSSIKEIDLCKQKLLVEELRFLVMRMEFSQVNSKFEPITKEELESIQRYLISNKPVPIKAAERCIPVPKKAAGNKPVLVHQEEPVPVHQEEPVPVHQEEPVPVHQALGNDLVSASYEDETDSISNEALETDEIPKQIESIPRFGDKPDVDEWYLDDCESECEAVSSNASSAPQETVADLAPQETVADLAPQETVVSPVPQEDVAVSSSKVNVGPTSNRCYHENCCLRLLNRQCYFYHTDSEIAYCAYLNSIGYINCKVFPVTDCKYGERCTKLMLGCCSYLHTKEEFIIAKNYKAKAQTQVNYMAGIPCKYGSNCVNVNCFYKHGY